MNIKESLERLRQYIERENFKGYDPYDILNSKYKFLRLGKWPPVIAIQFQKRNPLNIRNFLGIEKNYNPKGIGLLLEGYAELYKAEKKQEYLDRIIRILDLLNEIKSNGYSGNSWGYNFDWASPGKYIKAYTPSIVVTSFAAKGIFQYYLSTKDSKAIDIMRSSCDFILNDLPITETKYGICFSYTPLKKDCCYNANMLGAETLAKVYSITKEDLLRKTAQKAVDFTLAHQHDDGHWNYSIDLETGKERRQIDFHQGYILDSLYDFMKYTEINDDRYQNAVIKGAHYYRKEQFLEDGRSKWRIPRDWPIDIHYQAQGIITFTKLRGLDSDYLDFAERIAQWTIEHMQDDSGYFYYQKHRLYMNKISYMRWSQAWMFLALTYLLSVTKNN